jgi:hypothetical protein
MKTLAQQWADRFDYSAAIMEEMEKVAVNFEISDDPDPNNSFICFFEFSDGSALEVNGIILETGCMCPVQPCPHFLDASTPQPKSPTEVTLPAELIQQFPVKGDFYVVPRDIVFGQKEIN